MKEEGNGSATVLKTCNEHQWNQSWGIHLASNMRIQNHSWFPYSCLLKKASATRRLFSIEVSTFDVFSHWRHVPCCSWTTTYEDLLLTAEPFQQPIPLAVRFLCSSSSFPFDYFYFIELLWIGFCRKWWTSWLISGMKMAFMISHSHTNLSELYFSSFFFKGSYSFLLLQLNIIDDQNRWFSCDIDLVTCN